MTRRVLVAIATAAVVVGLCSACTGSGSKGKSLPSTQVIGATAKAMAASSTVEIYTVVSASGASPVTQAMIYDLRNHAAEVIPDPGLVGATVALVILDGSNSYMSLSGTQQAALGSDWLETNLDPLSGGDKSLLYLLDPAIAAPADMASVLDQMGKIVQSARAAGSATVYGIKTTCYDLAIGNQDLGSLFGTGSRSAVKSSGPIRLCVDADNRLRMIEASVKGSSGTTTLATSYVNYGVAVHVTVPPKADVISRQQLYNELCPSSQVGSSEFSPPKTGASVGKSGSSTNCSSKGS